LIGIIHLIQLVFIRTGEGEEFHLRITSLIGPFRIDRYSTRQLHCLNASSILARVRDRDTEMCKIKGLKSCNGAKNTMGKLPNET
jgi:hypothetical protein